MHFHITHVMSHACHVMNRSCFCSMEDVPEKLRENVLILDPEDLP